MALYRFNKNPTELVDNCEQRYAYVIKDGEKILSVGTRLADNELNLMVKVIYTMNKKISNGSNSPTCQYVKERGGMENLEIHILAEMNKKADPTKLLDQYKLDNADKFIFPHYVQVSN